MDLPIENVWGDVETEATVKRRESEIVAPKPVLEAVPDLALGNLALTETILQEPIRFAAQDSSLNLLSRASSVEYGLPKDNWGIDHPPINNDVDRWISTDRVSTTTPRYSSTNSSLVLSPAEFDPLGVNEEPVIKEPPEPVLPPSPTLIIQVLEPLQVGDKLSGRIEYRVATKTTLPFRNQQCSVMRRFSDFLWLYNQLLHKYPGVIIPPVPDKQAVGRFGEEFIENRRVALHRFMNLLSQHEVLKVDSVLQQFCESEVL
jgi:PX domain